MSKLCPSVKKDDEETPPVEDASPSGQQDGAAQAPTAEKMESPQFANDTPAENAQLVADISETQPGAYALATLPDFHRPRHGPPSLVDASTSDQSNANEPNSSESGLAVANPIDESSRTNLPMAEEIHPKTQTSMPGIGLSLTAILVAAGIVLILVYLLAGDSTTDTASLSQSPSVSPAVSVQTHLLTVLPGHTLFALEDSNAPQSQTFEWLLNDTLVNPNLSNARIRQRFVLATLYFATQGHNWTFNRHWLSSDHHECDWWAGESFIQWGPPDTQESPCNSETGIYERLWLPSNNLTGTLPLEVFDLTALQSMTFHSNGDLTGTISTTIHQVSNLSKLSLAFCNFFGTIPTQVGSLTQLSILYLANSMFHPAARKFRGHLPSEVGNLQALKQLTLSSNRFSGSLPTELGLLDSLLVAGLQDNQFSGSIAELGNLENLWALHLFSNQLTGSIPAHLGENSRLKELALSNNTLTGQLPSELGQLTDLYMLFLTNNMGLTGTVPDELSRLNQMLGFDIDGTSIDNSSVPDALRDAQNVSFHRYYNECRGYWSCAIGEVRG